MSVLECRSVLTPKNGTKYTDTVPTCSFYLCTNEPVPWTYSSWELFNTAHICKENMAKEIKDKYPTPSNHGFQVPPMPFSMEMHEKTSLLDEGLYGNENYYYDKYAPSTFIIRPITPRPISSQWRRQRATKQTSMWPTCTQLSVAKHEYHCPIVGV